MLRQSRLLVWVTVVGICFVLGVGVGAVVTRTLHDKYPSEWDARVLDLVHVVERERGALFDHPVPVDFLTPEQYSESTRTDQGTLTEEEQAEFEQYGGVMRALGLLPGDTDLLKATNDLADSGTLAYYDSAEERVVVRGTEVTPGLAVTLVHELTHVLQDQVFDLDRYDPDDPDLASGTIYAFQSLVEGDADRIEQRYVDSLDQATQDAIEAESSAGLDELEAAGIPAALTSLFGSMYGLGDAYVAVLEAADGQSVDGAFARPPVTEEQVFDPFEYVAGVGAAPVDVPDTDGVEAYEEGDFGAVSLMVVLAERIDPHQALAAATGWGGDAYTVFPRDGRTCFRMNVTGDTPEDTSELADALTAWVAAAPGGAASTSRNGDVVGLESCDPGSGSAGGTGGSTQAVELAVARSYIAAGVLGEGFDTDQARCFGTAMVDGLTYDELSGDDLPPALQRRVAGFAAACR